MSASGDGSDPANYVAAVVVAYVDLPETPLRARAQDRSCARRFYDDGVPLPVVESALLLASLRRLARPIDAAPLPPIRSLAYFRPVIDELLNQPLPDGYFDYLRLKLRKGTPRLPAGVQKKTFSRDR
jgi:hypothetical protein